MAIDVEAAYVSFVALAENSKKLIVNSWKNICIASYILVIYMV